MVIARNRRWICGFCEMCVHCLLEVWWQQKLKSTLVFSVPRFHEGEKKFLRWQRNCTSQSSRLRRSFSSFSWIEFCIHAWEIHSFSERCLWKIKNVLFISRDFLDTFFFYQLIMQTEDLFRLRHRRRRKLICENKLRVQPMTRGWLGAPANFCVHEVPGRQRWSEQASK